MMLSPFRSQALRYTRSPIPTLPRATASRLISTEVRSIRASQDETRVGRLTERNLEQAVYSIFADGLVVIENAIAHEHLDRLNEKMVKDAIHLASMGENSPFNYNKGNLQQDAPPIKEYFEPTIFLNGLATHLTSTILGPKPKLTFISGNSAMPSIPGVAPQCQPVHSDADFSHPRHPFALVVNVPLVTMTPENGSTEVWLGTHNEFGLDTQDGKHGDRASGRIKKNILEERRVASPPVQPVVPKGSVIVRDLRLWHAGMPNLTQDPRVMLAMIHFAPWYRNQMRVELGNSTQDLVQRSQDLDIRANFVPDDEAKAKYLNRGFGNSYDFDQLA